jgi:hypothetical protein
MAATVINPNGGWLDFLDINLRAYLKLQKVTGNSGYNNNAFIKNKKSIKGRKVIDKYEKYGTRLLLWHKKEQKFAIQWIIISENYTMQ